MPGIVLSAGALTTIAGSSTSAVAGRRVGDQAMTHRITAMAATALMVAPDVRGLLSVGWGRWEPEVRGMSR
jgi:hypothetical protein